MAPANAIQPARHWRLVITRLPSLLPIILLLSLYAPVSAKTPSPVDGGWPRDTTTPSGARLIIYQPRIATRIGQSDLVAYAAASSTPSGVQKAAGAGGEIDPNCGTRATENAATEAKEQ
jgi:hypothetical protein